MFFQTVDKLLNFRYRGLSIVYLLVPLNRDVDFPLQGFAFRGARAEPLRLLACRVSDCLANPTGVSPLPLQATHENSM